MILLCIVVYYTMEQKSVSSICCSFLLSKYLGRDCLLEEYDFVNFYARYDDSKGEKTDT